jgi:hypothetical protein
MKITTAVFLPLLAVLGTAHAEAATIAAVQSANGPSYTWRLFIGSNQSATTGWSFQVGAQNLQLEALGLFDLGGDGLDDSHPIGLWNSSGSLLSQVDLPSGTGGTLVGNYRYAPVTPITLTAGQIYYLGAYFGPVADLCTTACGDAQLALSTQVYAPGITYLASRQTQSVGGAGSLAFPNLDATVGEGIFGPNALFTAAEPEPVPEPASLGLVALGIGACLARHARRRSNS